jgi:RNA methyltransferase, TrmH family
LLTAAYIKTIKSLQLAKFRKELGQFVVEGDKAVRELLQSKQIQTKAVYALPQWFEACQKHSIQILRNANCIETNAHQLAAMTGLKTPTQVLAVAEIPQYILAKIPDNQWVIYLDQVQDPGNVGTILRLADWFGIEWVIASPDTADTWSPKVIQASMGAFARVKSARTDLKRLDLKNTHILAADMHGKSIYTGVAAKSGILIMGNEGQGISVSLEQLITERITIPRHPKGGAESLNVATATAIILSNLHLH